MSDGNKKNSTNNTADTKEKRLARYRRQLSEWQVRKHLVRGMAYGVGSGAVSLLVLWVQTRY
jgi:hypothetical protein